MFVTWENMKSSKVMNTIKVCTRQNYRNQEPSHLKEDMTEMQVKITPWVLDCNFWDLTQKDNFAGFVQLTTSFCSKFTSSSSKQNKIRSEHVRRLRNSHILETWCWKKNYKKHMITFHFNPMLCCSFPAQKVADFHLFLIIAWHPWCNDVTLERPCHCVALTGVLFTCRISHMRGDGAGKSCI